RKRRRGAVRRASRWPWSTVSRPVGDLDERVGQIEAFTRYGLWGVVDVRNRHAGRLAPKKYGDHISDELSRLIALGELRVVLAHRLPKHPMPSFARDRPLSRRKG